MVPIAPMALYGFVAKESHGMVPLVYLFGATAMLFTAFGYRELSRSFPIAGSVYSYVRRGWHPLAGFAAGWMILADYLLFPAVVYAFSASWLRGLLPTVPTGVWIVGFVLFNSIVNILGIEMQARIYVCLLLIQIIILIVFVSLAAVYIGRAHLAIDEFVRPFYRRGYVNWHFVGTATSLAAMSFLGFDAISTLGEEAVNPTRTIGAATIITLVILAAAFVLQTYCASLIYPTYQLLDSKLGFFDIAEIVGGRWLYAACILCSVISGGVAAGIAAQLAVSRVLYTMGRDHVLPGSRFLAYVHPTFRTPVSAIALVAFVTLLIALFVPEVTVLKLVNFGALSAFMMLNITVFVFYYLKQRKYSHVVRYAVVPCIGFCVVGFVWIGFDWATFLFGGLWAAAGAVLLASRYEVVSDANIGI